MPAPAPTSPLVGADGSTPRRRHAAPPGTGQARAPRPACTDWPGVSPGQLRAGAGRSKAVGAFSPPGMVVLVRQHRAAGGARRGAAVPGVRSGSAAWARGVPGCQKSSQRGILPLRPGRCRHAPPSSVAPAKSSGQPQCAEAPCLLPVRVLQEVRIDGEVSPEPWAAPEWGGRGWMSAAAGHWTWSQGSCRPHPAVAVSLLGLAGGEEAIANRKDTHVSNENTAARGSRSDALLMELFDAAIFGEPLWSARQHRVGEWQGGWALLVEAYLLQVNHVWPWPQVMSAAFSWRASNMGGHGDMWVPGGMPALCLSLGCGGLVGGSSQPCRSLWVCWGPAVA